MSSYFNVIQGKNEYAINAITEDLQLITWEEAFLCLTDETLPDALRAKYCYLIMGKYNTCTIIYCKYSITITFLVF